MYPDLVITVLLILTLFIVGALTIFSATRLESSNSGLLAELWRLYGVEFFIVAAVLIPAFYGGSIFMAVLLLFNLRAHIEIAHLHGYIHKINVIVTGVILSSILVITGFYFIQDKQVHNYLLSSTVFLLILVLFIHLIKRRYKYMAAILPMIIVALSLSCLWQISSMNNGFLLLIFLYLVTETNDAFALVFGKLIGRKKLCPAISPNKTWEGMLAGVVIAMTAGLTYNHYILNYKFLDSSLIIGLIIASAILGDLAFSAYKRVYKTKDFMVLIKGHGGIIDIYDSLLISSIAFYLLIQLTGSSRFS